MPNVPFYEPEETERETPFFKSLTAEYMSTIQPKTEWWSTKRGLRKTLHPAIPSGDLPKDPEKKPVVKIKVNS